MKGLFEKVALSRREQSTQLEALLPSLERLLEELFGYLKEGGIERFQVRIADEQGLREFHFRLEKVPPHTSLMRGRVSAKAMSSPLIQCELYLAEDALQLSSIGEVAPDTAIKLFAFLDDFKHSGRHAKQEVTPDGCLILLKLQKH